MKTEAIKPLYQKARGISDMSDNFMEPWEFKFAELLIQEVYSMLEDRAFGHGVPGVAEWIRDHLNEEYAVELKYDPELDDLK